MTTQDALLYVPTLLLVAGLVIWGMAGWNRYHALQKQVKGEYDADHR